MQTVKRSELSTALMSIENEKYFHIVIDDGMIKRWVGIGWVTERKATKGDYEKFPVVED